MESGVREKCKLAEFLNAEAELEKKKQIYNTYKLKLPDRGAKLVRQISELESLLQNLTLEAETKTHDTNIQESKKDEKSCNSDKCDINRPTINCEKNIEKPNAATEIKQTSDKSLSNSVLCKNVLVNDFKSNVAPTNELEKKTPKTHSESSLSFRKLCENAPKSDLGRDLANIPAFTQWREPENTHRTKLTEAKPLLEKPKDKRFEKLFYVPNQSVASEETVKKLHNSLVTYPGGANAECEPDTLKTALMDHQRKGLAWLVWRESQEPSGGILADDMGLGKTLTMISLILKQKEQNNFITALEDGNDICQGTLIVCLASIIHQWRDEINKHCDDDALTVLLYHGPKRVKTVKEVKEHDVVLTTYNILLSEYKTCSTKKKECPIFELKWERIILDEAHTIKNHASQTAQAVFCLQSYRKWSVTGTPIHNNFNDMYSLLKFFQFSPFDDYKKFKKLICDSTDSSKKRRNMLVNSILLRRTKDQVDDSGEPLIKMREKSISLCFVELSAQERCVYDELNEKVREKLDKYFSKHSEGVKPKGFNANSSLLVLLLRLQQCCSHLNLLGKEVEETFSNPVSEISLSLSSLSMSDQSSNYDSDTSDSSLDLTFSDYRHSSLSKTSVKSTKILKLFEELKIISEESGNKDKSVIVSQWVSMLEIIAYNLKEEGIAYHLIAGNTKPEDRQTYAEDLNYNDNGAKIMLLSLKAGGVGLNLIGANHLFLLDLHWNPALEMQACDRIHRVGQMKDVLIHKFVCKNTIEEKILCLQEHKSSLARSVLCGGQKARQGITLQDLKELFDIKI